MTTDKSPTGGLENPNDDGCVLGTAGRDEDPNAAPDYGAQDDAGRRELKPEDARGMPGYPKDEPSADENSEQGSGHPER